MRPAGGGGRRGGYFTKVALVLALLLVLVALQLIRLLLAGGNQKPVFINNKPRPEADSVKAGLKPNTVESVQRVPSEVDFPQQTILRIVTQSPPITSSKPSDPPTDEKPDPRRQAVVEAIQHTWKGYKANAWGFDEFCPISKEKKNWGEGKGIGVTIIDALDTLFIAGLKDEVDEAIKWIEKSLSFNQDIKLSMFESTIRLLGGLLSAYQLTGHKVLLTKATDLADRFLPAFKTKTGIPDNYINLKSGEHEGAQWNGGAAILSEFGSLQLEFRTLSQLTGNPKYDDVATKAFYEIQDSCTQGFCPRSFYSGGTPSGQTAGLGSFGDSYYEYLLKQWLLTKKTESDYKVLWDKAVAHIQETSVRGPTGHLIPNGMETAKTMEHLACFAGGLFALSYLHTEDPAHLTMAKDIASTCHYMYTMSRTGLAADSVLFDRDPPGYIESKFILRPETVETYFYLWRATKDPKYRDWGYEVLQACNKHLKVDDGYVGAVNVNETPIKPNDMLETFWLAETLKYLYLLFSEDSVINLEDTVFNTEAHPLKTFDALPKHYTLAPPTKSPK
jgi:mannosyl-oligosaccharide alpha-1,2-mannosidase